MYGPWESEFIFLRSSVWDPRGVHGVCGLGLYRGVGFDGFGALPLGFVLRFLVVSGAEGIAGVRASLEGGDMVQGLGSLGFRVVAA